MLFRNYFIFSGSAEALWWVTTASTDCLLSQ